MIKLNYSDSVRCQLYKLITRISFRREVRRLSENYKLLAELVQFADQKKDTDPTDRFAECYLILASKLVIDIQSCKIVWERGLYGTAHAILTVILRTVRMTAALHMKPELIPDFLDEEKTSDRDRAFMTRFSEGSLQKILDERFGKLERGEYVNLEKSVHASSVGTKIFYARIRHNPDGTKGGDLIFDAFLEVEKGGAVIGILSGAVIDMCGVLLERYAKDPFIIDLEPRYKRLYGNELKALIRQDLINRRN